MAAIRFLTFFVPVWRLARRPALSMALVLFSAAAPAIEEILFSAGPVRGHAWSVERMVTRLAFDRDGQVSAVVEAAGLKLPGSLKPIDGATAKCVRVSVDASGIRCQGGELRLRTSEGAPAFSPARFEAAYGSRGIRFNLMGLEFGGGVVDASFEGSSDDFSLSATAKSLPLPALLQLLEAKPAGINVEVQSGVVSGAFSWRDSKGKGEISASLDLQRLAFSDGAGLNAGENLVARFSLGASRENGPWRIRCEASVSAGQVYLHPLFVDTGEGEIDFNASGSLTRELTRLVMEKFNFSHHGVAEIDGSAALNLEANAPLVDRLSLETKQLALPRFYAAYLKPWLVESAFSKLTARGDASARISWSREGSSDAALSLRGLDLEDGGERFGVLGLSGDVYWSESGAPRQTRLKIESARFYRIDLGSAALVGTFSGSGFSLGAPLALPMLGGALKIDALEATGLGSESIAWRMQGALEPISLDALTSRLQWPPFSGSLSGAVPSLRYADGQINVDGKLSVRAFDGLVEIDALKLEQPFGVVPRASANVAVENLSLGALTQAFSFGRIEGRLSGRIDGLVLENWHPATFDARFATPANDRSRHRISQRAVKNLARLGGAGEVLSTTLLKLLESFSYDRLGISCRLKNGVCEMGGVEQAERGYYIVKGGGLPPRIDVFGFNTLVDWSTLVERLKAITQADEAVIR